MKQMLTLLVSKSSIAIKNRLASSLFFDEELEGESSLFS